MSVRVPRRGKEGGGGAGERARSAPVRASEILHVEQGSCRSAHEFEQEVYSDLIWKTAKGSSQGGGWLEPRLSVNASLTGSPLGPVVPSLPCSPRGPGSPWQRERTNV